MLWALGQPVVLAGLVTAFLLGVALRALAVRLVARAAGLAPPGVPIRVRPRADLDPFGAVVAALGGTGWGRAVDVDSVPRHRGRVRTAAVFAAGPVVTFLVAQLLLLGYGLLFPDAIGLRLTTPSGVLRGAYAESLPAEFLGSAAVGLLCFAVLALVPLPPLDGFGLLWTALRHPGPTAQRAKHWLADNNIGVAVLLVFVLFPVGTPLLLNLLDLLVGPLLWMWW